MKIDFPLTTEKELDHSILTQLKRGANIKKERTASEFNFFFFPIKTKLKIGYPIYHWEDIQILLFNTSLLLNSLKGKIINSSWQKIKI